jgi:HEAT repeat protein
VLKRAGDERATSAFQHVLRNLRAGGDEEARKIARDLAQKTASVGARRTAIALLREMGDKHLFAGLEEQALSTEDSPKRWAAIQAIAELDDPLAVPILGQVARGEDRKTMEVCTAVEGLGRIGTPAAAHELEEALPRHDDFWIGGRVIEALQAIGSETSIPILGRAALEKELPYHQGGHDVRRGAVQALGQYRNPAAARALEAALEAETVPDIREKAIAGLTNMDDEGSRPVLQRVACEPGFQKSVRTKAVESLAAIGGDAAVPSLQDVIRRAAEPDAAEVALRCLLQGPGEEALEFCRTLAQQSEDPQSRLNTACALRHAGEEQGAELVREITQDDTVPLSLRLRAAHSLLRRETQQLVEGVPPLTQDEEAMEAVCGALAGQTGSGYEVSLIWEIAEHLCESGWEPAAILGWQWVTLNSGHEQAAQRLAERGFDVPAHRGAITTWHLIGPFDNVPHNDLSRAFPPEQGVDLQASYPTQEGNLSWRTYTTRHPLGCVLLREVYGPPPLNGKVVVYAFCTVDSLQAQAAELRLGACDSVLV